MNEAKGITTARVAELLEDFTPAEVARLLDVSRNTIAYHAKKAGYVSPQEQVRELLPWQDLTPEDNRAWPYRMVYSHLEYMVTGGRTMSNDKLEKLAQFYEGTIIEFDTVVEFDPNIWPAPGRKYGRWQYTPRRPEDENLIVRINKYTRIPDANRDMFRLPKRWPVVEGGNGSTRSDHRGGS